MGTSKAARPVLAGGVVPKLARGGDGLRRLIWTSWPGWLTRLIGLIGDIERSLLQAAHALGLPFGHLGPGANPGTV